MQCLIVNGFAGNIGVSVGISLDITPASNAIADGGSLPSSISIVTLSR